MQFGQWVKQRRIALEMYQREVCEELGKRGTPYDRAQLSRLESGDVQHPSPGLVMALCRILRASPVEALEALGYEIPPPAAWPDEELCEKIHRLNPKLKEQVRGLVLALTGDS